MASTALQFYANVATSSYLVGNIATALNYAWFNNVLIILPLAIGVFVFLIGLRWSYRALSGK